MRRVPTATATQTAATSTAATAMAAFSNCANKLLLHFTFILRVRMPELTSIFLRFFFCHYPFSVPRLTDQGSPEVLECWRAGVLESWKCCCPATPTNLHFTIAAGFYSCCFCICSYFLMPHSGCGSLFWSWFYLRPGPQFPLLPIRRTYPPSSSQRFLRNAPVIKFT